MHYLPTYLHRRSLSPVPFLGAASPLDELRLDEYLPEAMHVALIVRHALRHPRVGMELMISLRRKEWRPARIVDPYDIHSVRIGAISALAKLHGMQIRPRQQRVERRRHATRQPNERSVRRSSVLRIGPYAAPWRTGERAKKVIRKRCELLPARRTCRELDLHRFRVAELCVVLHAPNRQSSNTAMVAHLAIAVRPSASGVASPRRNVCQLAVPRLLELHK